MKALEKCLENDLKPDDPYIQRNLRKKKGKMVDQDDIELQLVENETSINSAVPLRNQNENEFELN